MSIKAKLSIIISMIVTAILLLNNTINYFSTRGLMISAEETQMALVSKEIQIAIEHSNYGAQYVENVIGQELRMAAIAAQNALNPDIDKVTNAQLVAVAQKVGVSDITLFKKLPNGDIVGLKSSDPKELNLSTKDWGYWHEAFEQLLARKPVTVQEGQALPNYWTGPIDISSSDPEHVDKWGYYYDGTTNYIINPYVKDEYIRNFQAATGPNAILDKTLQDNRSLLEITGFNPETFGKPPVVTKRNGSAYVELGDRDILFGTYQYQDQADDVQSVEQAVQHGKSVSFVTTVGGKSVIKTFIPVPSDTPAGKPYVIGLVTDYQTIQGTLQKQLLHNILISVFILLLTLLASYVFAGYIVRPVHLILQKVDAIARGDFAEAVTIKRKDELGVLADRVDAMAQNLQVYMKELNDKQAEIQYQAHYDALTGLPNRWLFRKRLQTALQEAQTTNMQIAVLFIDLDRFKNINDTLGHSIGDLFLMQVSERLSGCLPENGVVSRLGGDEFTVLLPEIAQLAEAEQVAQTILQVLSEPYYLMGHELFSSTSIGISCYPTDGGDLDTLIKNADLAMYLAKEQGGHLYKLFDNKMNVSSYERLALESHLRKAIERNELQLCYQPKLNLQTNQIAGMEALLRWNSPELGFISPGAFIPLAEETGLIVPIGEWVLQTACRQNKAWQDAGFAPLRVAVNLSARQFVNHDLVGMVQRVLAETGLDPCWLELEITESTLMQNTEEIIETLHALKALGIEISIDDFGTGYSSLSYLKRFPIDRLKIDQSFVRDITEDLNDAEIATAIITLGHSLNLLVIAEGVETNAQLQFLLDKECDEMQGYLFSPALPVAEFEQFLLERQHLALALHR